MVHGNFSGSDRTRESNYVKAEPPRYGRSRSGHFDLSSSDSTMMMSGERIMEVILGKIKDFGVGS